MPLFYPQYICEQLYYHGEPISVNVHVTNNSTKTVKRVKISGQFVLLSASSMITEGLVLKVVSKRLFIVHHPHYLIEFTPQKYCFCYVDR